MEPAVQRLVRDRLLQALTDSPVALLQGPRQSGKTTLARSLTAQRGYGYFTLDDDVTRAAAAADPIRFVDDLPDRVVIDEVQRAPQLFTALKRVVDEDRRAGRFLLTGSADLLSTRGLSDSLAGRMEVVPLHPLAQAELEGTAPRFLDTLLGARFRGERTERLGIRLAERVVAGGYPAALARGTEARRRAWYRDYSQALAQRDVLDIARVTSAETLPRLLQVAAAHTASMLNFTELAAPFQLSRPTIATYVSLLKRLFLLHELPAWHNNRLKRLVKTPKLHVGDTGLAAALLNVTSEAVYRDRHLYGPLLETFVLQELVRQASWRDDDLRFSHFRDRDGSEVDVVVEAPGGTIAAVEVKAAATIGQGDFRGLTRLREHLGERFACGVLLHDGDSVLSFGDRLFAAPVATLWS
ncbi:MAG TPA: ATP-binding protein [Trueperaceae bacterium]